MKFTLQLCLLINTLTFGMEIADNKLSRPANHPVSLTMLAHERGSYDIKPHWSPDNKFIATVTGDTTANVYEAASGTFMYGLMGHTSPVENVIFLDEHTIATVAGDQDIRLFSTADGKLQQVIKSPCSPFKGEFELLSANKQGTYLAVASNRLAKIPKQANCPEAGYNELRSYVFIFKKDADSGQWKPNGVKNSTRHTIKKIFFLTENCLAIERSDKNVTELLDIKENNSYFKNREYKNHSYTLFADNEKIYSRISGLRTAIINKDCEKDGERYLLVYADGCIKLYSDTPHTYLYTIQTNKELIAAWFYSDNKSIITVAKNGLIELWDAQTGKQIKTLYCHDNGNILVDTACNSAKTQLFIQDSRYNSYVLRITA